MTTNEKNGSDSRSSISIFLSIFALIIAIAVPIVQNIWEKEFLESELIVIDVHLEVIGKNDSPLRLVSIETGKETKILKTNVTFVNQAISKYPLKIVDSKIDFSGGTLGQKLPIAAHQQSNPIFPSQMGNIEFFTPLVYNGNYTAKLKIWYYDPSKDKIKLFEQEVYEIHLDNVSILPNLRITPHQYYVTVKGYTIDEYEFGIQG